MVLGHRATTGVSKTCVALATATFALAACGGPAAHPPAGSAAPATAANTRSTAPARGFHLPASLLGLNQSTTATATQATLHAVSVLKTQPVFADPSAAFYQNVSGGPLILVYGSALSSAGKSQLNGDLASFTKGFV